MMTTSDYTEIARQVFVYGFPTVDLYRILHNFALDSSSSEFKAPFNTFGHARQLADPGDTSIVAMNVDTPYSYAWLDMRSEPVVVTFPSFEAGRYVSAELFDFYTNIIGYVSPRTNGNEGGDFLIAGPDWNSVLPAGIKHVFVSTSYIALILMRTQLFNDQDMGNVIRIQDQCEITPLSRSRYANDYIPKKVARLQPIKPVDVRAEPTHDYFTVLSWMLQFMPVLDEDNVIRNDMRSMGIVAGKPYVAPETDSKRAIIEGMHSGMKDIYARARTVRSSAELFGSRAFYHGDYLTRATAAFLGILGNAAEEYLGVGYLADADGQAFDGKNRYEITFKGNEMPPVDAFWSITVYTDKKFLYANPINRYVVNTPLIPSLTKNEDGGFTVYVQHENPGGIKASNWLPCPAGGFGLTFRTYLPQAAIRDGNWSAPPVQKVNE